MKDDNTYIIGLLKTFNERTFGKHLAECLIHNEHLINSYLIELNFVHFFGIKESPLKGNPPTLLMRMYVGVATIENSMVWQNQYNIVK